MFEGAYTALVTPFNANGQVDYGKLEELVAFQIEEGIHGLVPVGTTGESPTLDYDEHGKVIETVVRAAAGRVKVIAGTGGNSTSEALRLTQHAKDVGANGTLQVTPYYNKPSQEGLLRHFTAVADIGLPVVLYNIPGRTSREIALDTVVKLAAHPHVVAIKEATGDVDKVSQYLRRCEIEILSGDDALTLPMMAMGGVGVISVSSNLIPGEVAGMVNHALEGRWSEALAAHRTFHRLFCDLFIDTNPVPVKAALAMMGKIEETYRLPMCAMSDDHRRTLERCLVAYGLIQKQPA